MQEVLCITLNEDGFGGRGSKHRQEAFQFAVRQHQAGLQAVAELGQRSLERMSMWQEARSA